MIKRLLALLRQSEKPLPPQVWERRAFSSVAMQVARASLYRRPPGETVKCARRVLADQLENRWGRNHPSTDRRRDAA
jgi:hypothetical protein